MAWTTNVDYPTSTVITAAIWNGLLGATGNQSETAPAKVTTAGDLIYGTGANAIARLGVGSANQVLKVNSGATAPEWSAVAASELTAGNDKVFYSNSSGVVTEIALGGANTVLTSSGTTSAPSFAAAAGGGGSVQMTSSGSITAGNLVALSAANTVKEVTDGRVAPVTNTNAAYTQTASGAQYSSNIEWNDDTATPTIFVSWVSPSNSNWYVQAGTYSSNTVTWGTVVELMAGTTFWTGTSSCKYDSANGGWWAYAGTTSSGYYPYVNFNTVSGTSVTAGTPVANTQGSSSYYYIQASMALDTTNSKMVFCYGTGIIYYQAFTVSGTTVTIGAAPTYQSHGNFKAAAAFWNTTYERLVMIGAGSSTQLNMAYRTYDSGSGTYIATTINGANVLEPDRNVQTVNYANAGQGFDIGGNKYVYATANFSGYLIVTTFSADSASTGTIGTTSIFDGSSAAVADGTGTGQTIKIAGNGNWQGTYNTTTESLIIFARDADTGVPMRVHSLSYNSATDMWAEASTTLSVTGDGSGGTDIVWNGGAACQLIDSGGNRRAIWAAGSATNAAGAAVYTYLVVTGASGTTDAPDVLGIAADTVGTGVAVNVTVNGGMNENVTGLTSGSDYYIQGDGSLGTTAASPDYGKLGRAIATDKLLVTGIGNNTASGM